MHVGIKAIAVIVAAVALQQYSNYRKKHYPLKIIKKKKVETRKKGVAISPMVQSGRFIIEIEYCTRCRWMLRAAWMAQELLSTFQTPKPSSSEANDAISPLQSVVLTPNAVQGGVFQVYLHTSTGERDVLWSRKVMERFPESKELKQIVRDHIEPEKPLGHSDRK